VTDYGRQRPNSSGMLPFCTRISVQRKPPVQSVVSWQARYVPAGQLFVEPQRVLTSSLNKIATGQENRDSGAIVNVAQHGVVASHGSMQPIGR